jgi:uncharacterized protein YbjQ (UPF0145 family)
MSGAAPLRQPQNLKAALAQNERLKRLSLYSLENPRGVIIERYLGFISARVVYVFSMLKNLSSSLTQDNGARSEPFEKSFAEIERAALKELQKAAENRGADGVLGVRLDYHLLDGTGFAGVGGKLFVVVVTGTAVKIDSSPRPTAEQTAKKTVAAKPAPDPTSAPQPPAPSGMQKTQKTQKTQKIQTTQNISPLPFPHRPGDE